jgi:hypothetical protein
MPITLLICAGIILALALACSIKEKLMHRLILFIAAVLLACLPATAQQPERIECAHSPAVGGAPGHGMSYAYYSCEPAIEYALKNRQQEGSFYFFPFPPDYKALGRSRLRLYINNQDRTPQSTDKAGETQTVLKILATAEKVLGLEFPDFQIDRDPDSGDGFMDGSAYIPPVIHGVFARAKTPTPRTRQ